MDTIAILNRIGQAFVNFAVPMLIQSTVLILILLAADLIIRRRVRAVVRYYLWMLVLVKLVLPTSLALPTGIGNGIGPITNLHLSNPAAPPTVESASGEPITSPNLPTSEYAAPRTEAPTAAVTAPPITWQSAVFLAWLIALLIMTGLVIQRYFFVRGLVAQAHPAKGKIEAVFNECRRKMRMKQSPALRLSATTVSPAACGLIRPVILMPEFLPDKLTGNDLRAVLLHELAHVRRGDLWVNLAQTVLQIVYFYNPLVWVANTVIRRIREQAVDETVLAKSAEREPGETADQYAETLVSVAKLTLARPALGLRLIGVVESRSALAARLKHILSHPLPRTARLGLLGSLAIIIFAAVLLPMAQATTPPNFIIRGTVKDAATGKPIAGATVSDDGYGLKPYRFGQTDSAGKFRYKSWCEEHNVKAEAPGYQTQQRGFTTGLLQSEKEKVLDFGLIRTPSGATGNSTFTAILPSGVTVELLGVSYNPSRGKPWWKPDGSPLGKAPYDYMSGTVTAGDGERPRELAVRVTNIPASGVDTTWNTIPGTSRAGGAMIGDLRTTAVLVPANQDRIDVQFGVAAGPWQTIAQFDPRHSGSMSNKFGGFAYSELTQVDKDTTITVSDDIKDYDYRIVAVDRSGRAHIPNRTTSGSAGNVRQTTVRFPDLLPKDIKESQFQIRPYEWVTFRNVAMEPGMKTEVQTEAPKGLALSPSDTRRAGRNAPYQNTPDYRDIIRPLADRIIAERSYTIGTAATLVLQKDQAIRLVCTPNKYVNEIILHWTQRSSGDNLLMTYLALPNGTINKRGPMRKAFRIIGSDPGFAEAVSWDIRGGKMTVEYRTETDQRKLEKEMKNALQAVLQSFPTSRPLSMEDAARTSAEEWLALVDHQQYAESWNEAAALFKMAVPKDQWVQTMTALRKPLGNVLSRIVIARRSATSLPGAPDGQYVVLQFKTSFEHKKEAIETVTPMKEKNGSWRVSGYYIK